MAQREHRTTRPLYLPMARFTTVCTPHMIEQTLARTGRSVVAFMDVCNVDLTQVYENCVPGACHWVPVGRFLLYAKRKYNKHRRRNELELISLTPNNFTHTKTKAFAEQTQPKTSQSASSFPSWFADA